MNDSTGAAELWELVRAQQERIDALEAKLAPVEPAANDTKIGRRAVFGLAGVGVAAAAAMVVRPDAAAAADGSPINMGTASTNDAQSTTTLTMSGAIGVGLAVVTSNGANLSPALQGYGDTGVFAEGTALGLRAEAPTAIRATGGTLGLQAIGTGGYGATFTGEGVGQVRLIPGATSGTASLIGALGALRVDSAGDLYLCTVAGTPGTWVKLNNQTAGIVQGPTFLAVPKRGYDSRTGLPAGSGTKAKFAAAETRTVDLTIGTGLTAGRSAAIVNVTVVNTSGNGFASIYSGAATITGEPSFSNINWFADGQILANSATVALSPTGTIKIFASAPTDVLIDVVGFYA